MAPAGLGLVSAYGSNRRRERNRAIEERDQGRERLVAELEKELQTAHDLQMGPMPHGPPQVEGLQPAGRCLTANHVGGDFLQYFAFGDHRLAVCVTDVTGHAMDAAIPAVMIDGILDSQIRMPDPTHDLLPRLNRILCGKLTGRTHVAFSMADIDLATRSVWFANAGCPYPCHCRQATGDVVEAALDAFPLGVRPPTAYRTIETQLQPGDYVVLHSDGIAEAANGAEELHCFQRAVDAVAAACRQGLTAEGVVDHLLAAVRQFTGGVAPSDDMTCVAIRMDA